MTTTGKEIFFKRAKNTLRFVGITEIPGVLLSDSFFYYYFAPCSPEPRFAAGDSLPVFHVKQIESGYWRFELGNTERFETNIKPFNSLHLSSCLLKNLLLHQRNFSQNIWCLNTIDAGKPCSTLFRAQAGHPKRPTLCDV